REGRVQIAHGLLRHVSERAAYVRRDTRIRIDDFLPVYEDGTSADVAALGDDAQHGERRLALSRARLSHDSDDLALLDVEIDAVDDLDLGAVGLAIRHPKRAHREQSSAARGGDPRSLRRALCPSPAPLPPRQGTWLAAALVKRVPHARREEDERTARQPEGEPGPDEKERSAVEVRERLVEHCAPGGDAAAPDSDELQAGLQSD